MQTEERIHRLKLGVIQSELLAEVKLVCLDVLYDCVSETTIKTAQSASPQLDILKLIANANPKHANDLKWEALPLIEEAISGLHNPAPATA